MLCVARAAVEELILPAVEELALSVGEAMLLVAVSASCVVTPL